MFTKYFVMDLQDSSINFICMDLRWAQFQFLTGANG
jgi:hypothetical protein